MQRVVDLWLNRSHNQTAFGVIGMLGLNFLFFVSVIQKKKENLSWNIPANYRERMLYGIQVEACEDNKARLFLSCLSFSFLICLLCN